MTKIYRAHTRVPENIDLALVRDLLHEWVAINQSRSIGRAVRTWASLQPALAGMTSPAHIVDVIDAADPHTADIMLRALLELARGGDQTAGRTLLQSLLPGLDAQKHRGQRPGQSSEDRMQEIVGDLWQAIHRFPIERFQDKHAARLISMAIHEDRRITGRGAKIATAAADAHTIEFLAADQSRASLSGLREDTPTEEISLAKVLNWAISHNLVSIGTAELIAEVYTTDSTTNYRNAAQRRGITEAAARQRCSRALRRISEAAPQALWGEAITIPTQNATDMALAHRQAQGH